MDRRKGEKMAHAFVSTSTDLDGLCGVFDQAA